MPTTKRSLSQSPQHNGIVTEPTHTSSRRVRRSRIWCSWMIGWLGGDDDSRSRGDLFQPGGVSVGPPQTNTLRGVTMSQGYLVGAIYRVPITSAPRLSQSAPKAESR